MNEKWTLGFSKKILTPEDWQKTPYYLAGFDRGKKAVGVLDDIYVRSVYLDDAGENGGIVLAVVDCIGICNKEINEIRENVISRTKICKQKHINIMSTHVHSSPDTQGLWGKGLKSGVNRKYMAQLKNHVADCIVESINNTKIGDLFFGKALTENMILDNRLPFVHDDHLVRMRFVPDDGSAQLYMLNIGCHPELLGDKVHKISADWPAYCGRTIFEATKAEFIYFTGAIGAITCVGLDEVYVGKLDGEKSMIAYGNKMGEYALSISNEKKVPVGFKIKRVERFLPVKNRIFAFAGFMKVVKNDIIKVDALDYKKGVRTEVSYLEIGDIKILLVPGELFPELALGQFFSAEESATGEEYKHPTLFEMMGEGEKLIFGLANDEIGYIIPDNDFYIAPKNPYAFWNIPKDKHGRAHYEETTCSGPYAADMMRESLEQLLK